VLLHLGQKCLLKHVTEGKMKEGIEMTGRRERISKQLLKDLKEETEYWNLNQEALDGTVEN